MKKEAFTNPGNDMIQCMIAHICVQGFVEIELSRVLKLYTDQMKF